MKTRSQVWDEPPGFALHEDPTLVCDSRQLTLCYELQNPSGHFAIVEFSGLIDHHLCPINDEGLGSHPYAKAGLQYYEFNELFDSAETKRWKVLRGRHWVITFKDQTLDIVAQEARVAIADTEGKSPLDALLRFHAAP